MIDIERLWQSIYERENRRAAGGKFIVISKAILEFRSNRGVSAPRRILRNERKTGPQGCDTTPANEGLADEGDLPVAREGLLQIAMYQNYLYLVRAFPLLAQRAGYRESDVYR
jgi:hypothetical protein